MATLVESMAKWLVDEPEKVSVIERQDNGKIILTLKVASADMGKVIGRQGRIAKALRTVVKAAAMKENKRVSVEIVSEAE